MAFSSIHKAVWARRLIEVIYNDWSKRREGCAALLAENRQSERQGKRAWQGEL